MRLEHGGDRLAIPSEDEILCRPCGPNTTRPKNRHAFSAFATDAVVGDSIGVFLSELDAQLLGS
jgi:hypothetical protein